MKQLLDLFSFRVQHVGCSLLNTSIKAVSRWFGGVLFAAHEAHMERVVDMTLLA